MAELVTESQLGLLCCSIEPDLWKVPPVQPVYLIDLDYTNLYMMCYKTWRPVKCIEYVLENTIKGLNGNLRRGDMEFTWSCAFLIGTDICALNINIYSDLAGNIIIEFKCAGGNRKEAQKLAYNIAKTAVLFVEITEPVPDVRESIHSLLQMSGRTSKELLEIVSNPQFKEQEFEEQMEKLRKIYYIIGGEFETPHLVDPDFANILDILLEVSTLALETREPLISLAIIGIIIYFIERNEVDWRTKVGQEVIDIFVKVAKVYHEEQNELTSNILLINTTRLRKLVSV
jgi:hypothetical protein